MGNTTEQQRRQRLMAQESQEIIRLAIDAIDYLDRTTPKPAAAIDRLRNIIEAASTLKGAAK